MADKPKRASEYKPEQLELVRATGSATALSVQRTMLTSSLAVHRTGHLGFAPLRRGQ
jgi:hypothetical protein